MVTFTFGGKVNGSLSLSMVICIWTHWMLINKLLKILTTLICSWCQDNCLSLNVRKTKELIVDFRKRPQRSYTPLMISGTPVKRVSSFKYLGVNISEDLTWTAHIQTQVKKARQRLYHLRQLRKFRVSPAFLKTFYSGTIESVLTECISVWYGNGSNQDCKAHPGNVSSFYCHLASASGAWWQKLRDLWGVYCPAHFILLHILFFFILLFFFYL